MRSGLKFSIWGVIVALFGSACGAGIDPFPNLSAEKGRPHSDPPATAHLSATGPILATPNESSTISVTLRRADGSPMVGVVPELGVSGSGNTFSCYPSDASGRAVCNLTSNTPETKLIRLVNPPALALAIPVQVLSTTAFRYRWNAPAANPTATLPLKSGVSYNITVYWGDGTSDTLLSPGDPKRIHTYSSPGSKEILIHGAFSALQFHTDPARLLTVTHWGTQKWASMEDMFAGCSNLSGFEAPGAPDLTQVSSLARMFKGAVLFNAPIGDWDVSKVQDFSEMFSAANIPNSPALTQPAPSPAMNFNQPLDQWNTENATTFRRMFAGATQFNKGISTWNTSNVTDLSMMFYYAKAFNQPLYLDGTSSWDVRRVTTTAMMFFGANAFNSSLQGWRPTALQSMNRMFAFAKSFDQPLSWNAETPALTQFEEVFYSAENFNSPLQLDLGKVTSFNRAFSRATRFNQPLIGTLIPGSGLTALSTMALVEMFDGASGFNQPLNDWASDMARAKNLSGMFRDAIAFNQSLWRWDTSNVTDMSEMFLGAVQFNNGVPPGSNSFYNLNWDTGRVTTMRAMFKAASSFNNGIPSCGTATDGYQLGWNTERVTNMSSMFEDARCFNQNLNEWNVGQVTQFTDFDTGNEYNWQRPNFPGRNP